MPNLLTKIIGDPSTREVKRARILVERINRHTEPMKAKTDAELRAVTDELRGQLEKGATLDALLPEAFAAVREAAGRAIGMRHYDVQLIGGIVLHQGKIAEMRTGEGKTLTETAPLYLNALSGKGVHLVTVNDYLSRRDAGWMAQIFHLLGLSTGIIVPDAVFGVSAFVFDPEFTDAEANDERLVHLRPAARGEAYACDVTYGTNNEFGFDYLRDNMVDDLAKMVQRPLNFAIVDEVDSILIDEARTPLIISAPSDEATQKYYEFARLAARLDPETDYSIDEKQRAASLTDEGISAVEKALGVESVYEAGRIEDVHHVEAALKAVAIYQRDRDYVVRDGEIIIVDEFTGRLMPGRRWSDGLHQAIEAKENVPIKQESLTLASITFQNYFRLYKKLSGMTGTAATEAEEFVKIYNLDVVTVPTHHPSVRKDLADRIYKSEAGKFKAIAVEVAERHKTGQPVLIGTVSIAKNELLGQYLTQLKVPHQILNAKNNETEAATIASAGAKGAVTLATNIAGRGTDIVLEPGVDKLGGLHVLGTERHESRRIDNQLRGRSGRQGDPGSTQFFVSLEDDLMRIFGGDRIQSMMTMLGLDDETPIENKTVSKSLEGAQKRVEGHHFDERKHVVEYDDVMNKHREAIYSRRRRALAHANLREEIEPMVQRQLETMVTLHTNTRTSEVDSPALIAAFNTVAPLNDETKAKLERAHPSELVDLVMAEVTAEYDARAASFGVEVMPLVERFVYVNALDRLWIDHLEAMDSLRNGIGLHQIAQRDPLVEYKRQGYRMYKQLIGLIEADVASTIFKVTVTQQDMAPQAPVETALTRAAAEATSNAALDGVTAAAGSRSDRRAKPASVTAPQQPHQNAKKRKKRR